MNNAHRKKYEQDFPVEGMFNWKKVVLKTPTKPYTDGHKVLGVVLHDGNFMTNGVLFLKNEYEVVDESPMQTLANS